MWKELWEHHRGKIAGTASGLFLSLVYLISGFWDMLIVSFIVYLGYTAGRRIDRNQPLLEWDEWVRWLTQKWRMFR